MTRKLPAETVQSNRFGTSEFVHMHELLHYARPGFRQSEMALASWFLAECLRDGRDTLEITMKQMAHGNAERIGSNLAESAQADNLVWLRQCGFLEVALLGHRGRATIYRLRLDWNPESMVDEDWPSRELALEGIREAARPAHWISSSAATKMVRAA